MPHTAQDVLNVIEKERPEGIIVQFGGQTPLSIAKPLQEALLKNPVQAASGEHCSVVSWISQTLVPSWTVLF